MGHHGVMAAAVGPDALRAVVEQATHAPSIHNTQPWRFRLGPDEIRLEADADRALAVIDPSGRQLHISCGSALEFAVLALRAAGHESSVAVLPDPDQPQLLAVVSVGSPVDPSDLDRSMAAAIERRHTHRDPFDERAVPQPLVDAFRDQVEYAGAWLRVLGSGEEQAVTAVLLARADEAERADPAYDEELRRWTRETGPGQGVPEEAMPATPPGGRRSSMRLRDFTGETGEQAPDPQGPVEHPLVVLLGTREDDRASWIRAGRALARLLLRAAVDEVFASPLNQVLDVHYTRMQLGRELGVVGFPQMLLRMGFAHDGPHTGRRPVDEVLG